MPTVLKTMLLPALLLIAYIVTAQGNTRGVTENTAVAAKDTVRNVYAVIAGVSKYKNLHPLNYADEDAILFKNFLQSPGGGNVKPANIKTYLNEDVTEGTIATDCFQWLNDKKPGKGDRIYFYLAGHGDGYNNKYFFFTSDAVVSAGPKNFHVTGNLKISDLIDYLSGYVEENKAEVFLIIDACRTNESSNEEDKERASNFSKVTSEKYLNLHNFFTFYSTKDGYPSYESNLIGGGHGLFTYYLVNAMMGKADDEPNGDQDNTVTLLELESWLKKEVPKKSKELFNAQQMPTVCCEVDENETIATVNVPFRKQYFDKAKSIDKIFTSDSLLDKGLIASRSVKAHNYDVSILELYKKFVDAVKSHRLTGENSAEYYYKQLLAQAPNDDLTEDARHQLIVEFVDFAQAKINLYLSGEDIGFIRNKTHDSATLESDLDDDSYIKLTKVYLISFGDAAEYLEKAMKLIGKNDKLIARLEPKLLFLKARSYFDKNNNNKVTLKEAINLTEKAMQKDTGAVHLYHLMAILQLENNNQKKAQEYFTKAMEGETHWSKANLELGYYYYQLKNYNLADKYYRMAIISDKNYAYAYNNLGILMQQEKRYDEAEILYKQSIEKSPKDTILRHNLANFYNEKALSYKASKKLDSAEKYFLKAIQTDSGFAHSYVNLGNVYFAKKDNKKAELYYRKALLKDSTNISANYNLAILLFNTQKYAQADAYFDKVIALSKPGDDYYILAQRFSNEIFKLNGSSVTQKPIIKADTSALSLYHSANHYYLDSNYAMAEQLFLQALQKDPNSPVIQYGISVFYYNTNRPEKAIPYLQKYIDAQSADGRAYLLLGDSYLKQNKRKDAEKTYLSYYKRNRKSKETLMRLIALYEMENNSKEVKRYTQELNKL